MSRLPAIFCSSQAGGIQIAQLSNITKLFKKLPKYRFILINCSPYLNAMIKKQNN